MKKALSLILSLVMVLTLIPMVASVASAEAVITEPTTSSTVEIADAEAFIALLGNGKTAENTKYVLKADIDLSTEGTAKDITATPFVLKNSSFDGEGHSIKGFTYSNYTDGTSSAWASVGLFSVSGTASIKNLTVGTLSSPITVDYSANYSSSGILIGTVPSNSTLGLDNVSVWGNMSQTEGKVGAWNKKVGMFIGDTSGNVTIIGCVSNGVINVQSNGGSHGAGGFIGFSGETSRVEFDMCINNTNLEATISNSKKHGGFVGSMHSDYFNATDCTNNGDLLTTDKAASATVQEIGGLIGDTWSSNTSARQIIVDNFANYGDISGTTMLGSVIGCNNLGSRSNDNVYITNSKNFGNITATNGHAGGAIGVASAVKGTITVSDYFNAGNVTSTSSAGGVIGISEPSGDNSAQVIDIDRLINTGAIKGKWRGCAATGYIKNATVTIDNSINTGSVIKASNNSISFAFSDNADITGNVTGSGNYAVNGITLGEEGFSENLDVSFDTILGVINNADNNFAHGHFALNAEGNNIVVSTPEFEGHQVGAVDTETNTYKIRFLATINDVNLFEGSCEYKYLGMQFSNDGGETWGITGYAEYVYTSVLGNVDGTLVTYTAEMRGGKYVYAFTADLDATADKSYVVRTFAVDKNGNEIYGNACAVDLPAPIVGN